MRLSAVRTRLGRAVVVCAAASLAGAAPPAAGGRSGQPGTSSRGVRPARTTTPSAAAEVVADPPIARVRWLAELGIESSVVSPAPAAASLAVPVPGAVYLFARGADGALKKRRRLAADPAAPYGAAVAGTSVVLADRDGAVSLWSITAAEPSLVWRRELGDRVTSVGWNGGPLVFVATWKGRLEALVAADGRPAWSADLGGRAEAPAVADGDAVFVATKARTLARIDARAGAVRWRVALPGMTVDPPALAGERPRLVVCGTMDGRLVAYDVITGRLAWSAPLDARLAGAPLAKATLVAAVTSDGVVHGYDLSGRSCWTAPGAAEGPASLLWQESAGAAARLLSVSKVLVSLNASTGERLVAYPQGVLDELRRRFADAMLDGVKTYSEPEKQAIQSREAPDISGPAFGPARFFGAEVAFGTEEGWAYAFDAATLRPRARYHGGQPVSAVRSAQHGGVMAAAGEEVYALDAASGAVAWKRTVGGEASWTAAGDTLGVLAGGRIQALAANDGSLGWTLRGSFRSVAADEVGGSPWLVDDGEGRLRALVAPGRFAGDPLPLAAEPLAVAPLAPGSWVVATRDGMLQGVTWAWLTGPVAGAATPPPQGRLETAWQKSWDEPIAEVHVASGRVLVRLASGAVAGFDPGTQQESWRITPPKDARLQPLPRAGVLLVLAADAIDVHDWGSGESRGRRELSAPALAADLHGDSLSWLDRLGRAHRASLGRQPAAATDLAVALAEATPVEGGFLVRTAAGEVGRVDVAQDGTGTGDTGAQARGVR